MEMQRGNGTESLVLVGCIPFRLSLPIVSVAPHISCSEVMGLLCGEESLFFSFHRTVNVFTLYGFYFYKKVKFLFNQFITFKLGEG